MWWVISFYSLTTCFGNLKNGLCHLFCFCKLNVSSLKLTCHLLDCASTWICDKWNKLSGKCMKDKPASYKCCITRWMWRKCPNNELQIRQNIESEFYFQLCLNYSWFWNPNHNFEFNWSLSNKRSTECEFWNLIYSIITLVIFIILKSDKIYFIWQTWSGNYLKWGQLLMRR